MNLAHTLARTARRLPAQLAVIDRSGASLTFAALSDRSLRLAAALQQRCALRPGARVGLLMHNCSAYLELLYGCWAAGLAAVPINVKLHPAEAAWILADADCALAFVNAGVEPPAGRADGAPLTIIDTDGADYRALLAGAPQPAAHDTGADALAWLFYTSGTTGRPKGVMLTHANLLAMALNYLADVEHAAPGEHQLHAAPMSHGSGLYALPTLAAGSTQLITASRGFDLDEIAAELATTPQVKLFAAPTMVMRLVDALAAPPATLKTIVYGGGPMYVADTLRALVALGPRLTQIYGQGESPMTITVLPPADHLDSHDGRLLQRLGSVGRAQTGVEVAVLDAQGQPLPADTPGEVCVRGPTVMAGYLGNPAATAEALAGGWLHTGDIGRLDAQGYLTLVDRSKDLIISGGSNIYPREVEEVLLRHPAVREVAVLGTPDAEWGEAVVAVVALRAGMGAGTGELDAFCLQNIARFKRPKRYVFVDSLPKNATGKVLKRELRAALAAE